MGRYLSLLASNSSSNLGFYCLNQVLGLVSYAVLIRVLGLGDYGLLMLMHVLSGQFQIFSTSLGTSLTKFVPEFRQRGREEELPTLIFGTFFVLLVVGLIVSMAIALILIFDLYSVFGIEYEAGVRSLFIVAIITTPLNYAGVSFGNALKGFHRFHYYNVIDLTFNVMTLMVSVALAVFDAPLYVIFLAIELLLLSKYCIMFIGLRVKFEARAIRDFVATAKEVSHYTKWTVLQSLNSAIVHNIDSLIVSLLLGVQSLPVYRGLKKIIHLPTHLNAQFKSAFLPIASELGVDTDNGTINDILLRGTAAVSSATAPLAGGIIIFAEPILRLLGGEHLSQYTLVTQVLMLFYILLSSRAFIVTFHVGHGALIKQITKVMFATSLIGVGLLVTMARNMGIEGAISSAALAQIVTFPVLLGIVLRQTGLGAKVYLGSVWRVLSPIVLVLVVYIFVDQAFGPNLNSVFIDYLVKSAFLLVMLGLTWCMSVSQEIKNLILTKLSSVRIDPLFRRGC